MCKASLSNLKIGLNQPCFFVKPEKVFFFKPVKVTQLFQIKTLHGNHLQPNLTIHIWTYLGLCNSQQVWISA